jgi:hypothetical protein
LVQPALAQAPAREEVVPNLEPNLLAKLGGVNLVFASVETNGATGIGVEKAALEAQVLADLRLAQVTVITEDAFLELKPGAAVLHVSVNLVLEKPSGLAAYSVNTRCLRPALIDGGPRVALATTWEVGAVGLETNDKARERTASTVRAQVAQFIDALRAATRRTTPPGSSHQSPL